MKARRRGKSKAKIATAFKVALTIVPAGLALVTMEAPLRAYLDDTGTDGPTRFYARPLVVRPGATIQRSEVEEHLSRLGYRRSRSQRNVGVGEYYLGYRSWTIGRRPFRHSKWVDPGGITTVRVGRDRITDLRDTEGQPLRAAVLEPEPIRVIHGSSNEDRIPIVLSDAPPHLIDAVLAIEDQRFFEHTGLDWRRIVGAVVANARARRIEQGASTITQQLAKNRFLTARRSPIRKLREALMATTLEARYDKQTILQAYVNEIYLGQDGALAIHGVGSAARHYFGKDVSQLHLSESALLAGIIRGPSIYSPFRHAEAATGRRNLVLQLMFERGLISETEYTDAKLEGLGLRRRKERSRTGRYFADYVAARLKAEHGDDVLNHGLAVVTTLDMRLQHAAERATLRGLEELEDYYPRLTQGVTPLQAALVAIDPRSGEVLAMVGGRDYGTSQFNRAVWARRQPGSSFKPIVAMAALTIQNDEPAGRGGTFTLASLVDDEPLSVETPAGLWQPANYDERFRGSMTLREALERSLNVPFARLGMEIGPERIAHTAKKLGVESRLHLVPSLALGSSEVTPLEMTRAFGVFAANGFRSTLNTTIGVLDKAGNVLHRLKNDGELVYAPAEAFLITSALQGAVERGTGRGIRRMGYRGPVAAKSGTTNDFRDAWFVGYTPTIAIGVWVGFDDGRSVGLSGSRAALPIFARFLADAVGRYGHDDFLVPDGIEVVEIDQETGLLAGPGCRGEPEVFLDGTAPEESCSRGWNRYRRYASNGSRWYDRVAGTLIDEVRRLLLRDRR